MYKYYLNLFMTSSEIRSSARVGLLHGEAERLVHREHSHPDLQRLVLRPYLRRDLPTDAHAGNMLALRGTGAKRPGRAPFDPSLPGDDVTWSA